MCSLLFFFENCTISVAMDMVLPKSTYTYEQLSKVLHS